MLSILGEDTSVSSSPEMQKAFDAKKLSDKARKNGNTADHHFYLAKHYGHMAAHHSQQGGSEKAASFQSAAARVRKLVPPNHSPSSF